MLKYVVSALILFAAALIVFNWEGSSEIKHYTAEELAELTCEALSERHEEVIVAYHDAEIEHYKQSGSFHDDVGIPPEDVVPYAVLMKQFMHDSGLPDADIVDASSATPILSSNFYYAISTLCATNPSWQAVDAMRKAAIDLDLIKEP